MLALLEPALRKARVNSITIIKMREDKSMNLLASSKDKNELIDQGQKQGLILVGHHVLFHVPLIYSQLY